MCCSSTKVARSVCCELCARSDDALGAASGAYQKGTSVKVCSHRRRDKRCTYVQRSRCRLNGTMRPQNSRQCGACSHATIVYAAKFMYQWLLYSSDATYSTERLPSLSPIDQHNLATQERHSADSGSTARGYDWRERGKWEGLKVL